MLHQQCLYKNRINIEWYAQCRLPVKTGQCIQVSLRHYHPMDDFHG